MLEKRTLISASWMPAIVASMPIMECKMESACRRMSTWYSPAWLTIASSSGNKYGTACKPNTIQPESPLAAPKNQHDREICATFGTSQLGKSEPYLHDLVVTKLISKKGEAPHSAVHCTTHPTVIPRALEHARFPVPCTCEGVVRSHPSCCCSAH